METLNVNDRLRSFGWSEYFSSRLAESGLAGAVPARVVETQRGRLLLQTPSGPRKAEPAGRLFRGGGVDLPVVGDWVVFQLPHGDGPAVVSAVLPRRNRLSRKMAGARSEEQVVAANVDLVLVVMGLDGDFNPRRLERFLAFAEASGASAAVVLNKMDACDDPGAKMDEVRRVTSAPTVIISALAGSLEALDLLLEPRSTAVLVGSSGAGKSTIVNRLRGDDALSTGPVREGDSRGRHTTSHRELFRLPGGSLVIDSPGVREIAVWRGGEEALSTVFEDVEEFAAGCRFSDCAHEGEPGCAVREAIERGELEEARLESLRKLENETAALERRKDERSRREHDRNLGKLYRSVQRDKRNRRDRSR